MTHETHAPSSQRIPQFVGIATPPRLFFTVNNGEHTQSVKVIEELARVHRENPTTMIPLCSIFDYWSTVPNDIPHNSVLVFDDKLGKRCFSGLCWEMNNRRKPFVPFQNIEVLWGFAINSSLNAARVASAVNQLKADFEKNFLTNLDGGNLPWGAPPTPRVKRKRTRGKKYGWNEERLYSFCAW